jgi:hypothetical protein
VLASHAASLWGIEANYPGADNSYLTEVANELLPGGHCCGPRNARAARRHAQALEGA